MDRGILRVTWYPLRGRCSLDLSRSCFCCRQGISLVALGSGARCGLLTPGRLVLSSWGPIPFEGIMSSCLLGTRLPGLLSDVSTIYRVVAVRVMLRTIFEGVWPISRSRTTPSVFSPTGGLLPHFDLLCLIYWCNILVS